MLSASTGESFGTLNLIVFHAMTAFLRKAKYITGIFRSYALGRLGRDLGGLWRCQGNPGCLAATSSPLDVGFKELRRLTLEVRPPDPARDAIFLPQGKGKAAYYVWSSQFALMRVAVFRTIWECGAGGITGARCTPYATRASHSTCTHFCSPWVIIFEAVSWISVS